MYEILRLNNICKNIYSVFDDKYTFSDTSRNPDAIILRSYKMHDYPINKELLAIGRAGAGVNNIPIERMTEHGVVVFNTPGANANAVKELVLCGMLLASRDILGGAMWVNSLNENEDITKETEKNKAVFGGTEIFNKTLGIVGLGAIGTKVADAAMCLGMKVIGFDPYITEGDKENLDKRIQLVNALDELYSNSNFITLHVPHTEGTTNMINAEAISFMKFGAVLLNMSRAEVVDARAIKEALGSGKISKYVVDFPTAETLKTKNVIMLPHLGASTEEAEENCASMAAMELKDYIENGNIKNSVNFPQIQKPRTYSKRYCLLFKEGFNVTQDIESFLKSKNIVCDVAVSEKGKNGYMIIDSDSQLDFNGINNKGILKIRYI